jgi:protein-disulfide isomerase
MHDALFLDQKRLKEASPATLGRALNLDIPALRKCLDTEVASTVRKDQEDVKQFGVRGTPAFLIGTVEPGNQVKVLRVLSGAQPFEAFSSVIEDVRASREAAGKT